MTMKLLGLTASQSNKANTETRDQSMIHRLRRFGMHVS